jgi:hypothetical protein
MNMRSLINGFNGLNKAKREKREASTSRGYYVTLNIGAFIRKATNNGKDKTMSTYWTYQGSETVPGKYAKNGCTLERGDIPNSFKQNVY